MGVEYVELVTEIESTFGISISDAEAERCRTPSDVIDLVLSKVGGATEKVCISQRAFHHLRRGLVAVSKVERAQAAVDSRIRSFISASSEQQFWHQLRQLLVPRAWPTSLPVWMSASIAILPIGITSLLARFIPWETALIPAGLITYGAVIFTKSHRNRIPLHISTVRDLIPYVTTSEGMHWAREQVATRVQAIVVEILGLKAGEYAENADFVRELGLS